MTQQLTGAESMFSTLATAVQNYSIAVSRRPLDADIAGEFDGWSITVNTRRDLEPQLFYLTHSFGSIVEWSVDYAHAVRVFEELRAAKAAEISEPQRFELALKAFRDFEEIASEYAVTLLREVGCEQLVAPYTEFFRADLEAMCQFHRQGVAPDWPTFFAGWKNQVARGERVVAPYTPRPIPRFQPVRIEEQPIIQKHNGVG